MRECSRVATYTTLNARIPQLTRMECPLPATFLTVALLKTEIAPWRDRLVRRLVPLLFPP